MLADRDAPMPPVFMHSSTMMTRRVLRTLRVMASMSKGFKLIRSITCTHAGWLSTLNTGNGILSAGLGLIALMSSGARLNRCKNSMAATGLAFYTEPKCAALHQLDSITASILLGVNFISISDPVCLWYRQA